MLAVGLLTTLAIAQQRPQPLYTTPPTFPQPQQMPPDQKAPPPQALSSSQVEQQIQKHLSTEPDLANAGVQVKADDRLVILTGTVDSDAQHDLALRIAQSYAGERKIVDKIKVRQQT